MRAHARTKGRGIILNDGGYNERYRKEQLHSGKHSSA